MKSYQLHINIRNDIEIEIGKLGSFKFPKGNYIYTGSAKQNIDGRIARHRLKPKDIVNYYDTGEASKKKEIALCKSSI